MQRTLLIKLLKFVVRQYAFYIDKNKKRNVFKRRENIDKANDFF